MEMNAIILDVSEWIGVIAVTLLLTISRKLVAKPVAFKYQQREIILSSILAVLLIAAAFYANLVLKLPTLPQGAGTGWRPAPLGCGHPAAGGFIARHPPPAAVERRPFPAEPVAGSHAGRRPGAHHHLPARQGLQPAGWCFSR